MSRHVPPGGQPARRPLRYGGTTDGYLKQVEGVPVFFPFDKGFVEPDFTGPAYPDATVPHVQWLTDDELAEAERQLHLMQRGHGTAAWWWAD